MAPMHSWDQMKPRTVYEKAVQDFTETARRLARLDQHFRRASFAEFEMLMVDDEVLKRYGLPGRGQSMSKFLFTVCIFGLLLSSAFAQEKTPEQLREERSHIFGIEGLENQRFTRVVASGAKHRIDFYASLNPDCSASGDSPNCTWTTRLTSIPARPRAMRATQRNMVSKS